VLGRRSLWLLTALAALGWALAVVTPRSGTPAETGAESGTVAAAETETLSVAETGTGTVAAAETETVSAAETGTGTVAAAESVAETGTVQVRAASSPRQASDRKGDSEADRETAAMAEPAGPRVVSADENESVRAVMMAHALERRRVNDARFAAADGAWQREGRDEGWAPERERVLLSAMQAGDTDAILVHLECRTTLCRFELQVPDSHSFLDRNRSQAFVDALGDDTAAHMEGSPSERLMILFAARDGHPLEPPLPELGR